MVCATWELEFRAPEAARQASSPWPLRLFVCVVLAGLLLAACTPRSEPPKSEATPAPQEQAAIPPEEPLEERFPNRPQSAKVAILLPLSGSAEAVGETMLKAAQMALFEQAGPSFALIVKDTGDSPEQAAAAAREALEEGASLILGPLFARSTPAVADEARPAGVSVISFSNDLSEAGAGVYVMGLAPEPQVERVLGFASAQGLRSFAVVAPNTPYGDAVISAMRDSSFRYGGQLARVQTYDAASQDMTAAAQSVAASPDYQAIMLPEGGRRALTMAPLLAYYDLDPATVRFLGTAQWDDAALGSEPNLQGGWFAAPQPEAWRAFSQRYLDAYGAAPPRIASLAYDATALAAVLARRSQVAGPAPDYDATAITQPNGFSGIDGLFRFRADGTVERGLAVLEMRAGGPVVIDPAPISFAPLVN